MAAEGTHWTLEDLYRGIMQSWVVLVSMILAFMLIGAGIFAIYPQKYTAVAQRTVEPISVLSSGSSFNTVNMETEKVVATSTAVLDRAVEELEDTSVEALRTNTVIQVPRNSQVLIFEVTANSPQLAADRANALAKAYGDERSDNARAVVETLQADLTESIIQLQELSDSQPAGSSEHAATQLQLQALLDQQARITATPFYSGMLLTSAYPPQDSNRPAIYVFIAAGMFLGILLGAIAALIVSRVRNSPGHAYRRTLREEGEGESEETGGETPGVEGDPGRDEEPDSAAKHKSPSKSGSAARPRSAAKPRSATGGRKKAEEPGDEKDSAPLDKGDVLIEPPAAPKGPRPRKAVKKPSKSRT